MKYHTKSSRESLAHFINYGFVVLKISMWVHEDQNQTIPEKYAAEHGQGQLGSLVNHARGRKHPSNSKKTREILKNINKKIHALKCRIIIWGGIESWKLAIQQQLTMNPKRLGVDYMDNTISYAALSEWFVSWGFFPKKSDMLKLQ